MANPELGAKQVCPNCQAKFYDLNRRPAHCPKCGTDFDPEEAMKLRSRRARPGYPSDDEDTDDQVTDKKVDGDEDEEDDESSDDLDDLAWEDVFDRKAQPTRDESEDEAPRPKEKRMTTSKRKAENYYTHANVKNRNRQKQAAMSELHAQSRHRDRGSRVGANKKASRTSNPKLQKRK